MYLFDLYPTTAGWEHRLVYIKSPTGTGKTTFLLKRYIPDRFSVDRYTKVTDKVLYLVNRKILNDQIEVSIEDMYGTVRVLDELITVQTYQEFEASIRSGTRMDLHEFCAIICDEAHFFLADSTFNGRGTTIPFTFILYHGIKKSLVFASATFDGIAELISKGCDKLLALNPSAKLQLAKVCRPVGLLSKSDVQPIEIDVSEPLKTRYSYIQCNYVPDLETLTYELAKSESKSMVFIDSRKKGMLLEALFVTEGGIKKTDICLLNREDLNGTGGAKEVVDSIVTTRKLPKKILVTTSILDNGVSIEDPLVENLAIVTESKTSFLQMLGRIRVTSSNTGKIKLFLVERKPEEFDFKLRELEKVVTIIRSKTDEVWDKNPVMNSFKTGCELCTNADQQLSKLFIPLAKTERTFWFWHDMSKYLDSCIYVINPIAKQEFISEYDMLRRYSRMAKADPLSIAKEQLSWIGKTLDDLSMIEEMNLDDVMNNLKQDILKIQGVTKEEYSDLLAKITMDYRNALVKLVDYEVKSNRNLTADQFAKLLELLNLAMEKNQSKDDRKLRYTIRNKEEDNNEQ